MKNIIYSLVYINSGNFNDIAPYSKVVMTSTNRNNVYEKMVECAWNDTKPINGGDCRDIYSVITEHKDKSISLQHIYYNNIAKYEIFEIKL